MFGNKIYFDINNLAKKETVYRYLVSQKDGGIIHDIPISIKNKGIPLSDILNSALHNMIYNNILLEIHSDCPVFMLDFIEESFSKEFVLVDYDDGGSHFIINTSNDWVIDGYIFNGALAEALNSHILLDGSNVTLENGMAGEYQYSILNVNKSQMELVANCFTTKIDYANQIITILK